MRVRSGGNRSVLGLLIVAGLTLSGGVVQAQEPPYDPAVDVQLFEYNPGPRNFMSVMDGSLAAAKQYSIDFLLTFLTDPFVIYDVDENQDAIDEVRTDVVKSMFAGQLVGAYGLTKDLQLGVSLPLVFSMSGDGLDPSTGRMSSGGLQATGLGDLHVQAKGRIMRNDALSAVWFGGISAPTSFGAGGNDFLGDDLPSVRGGAGAHWRDSSGKFTVGGSASLILRKPRKIYAAEVGQQLAYGVGASYRAADSVDLIAETFGRTSLSFNDLDSSPLEVGGGVRVKVGKAISVLVGGGAGVVSGIGSPGMRMVASVGYAPDLGDTDQDGIPNMQDGCPLLPEDMDDFEDSDGCPDNDNDGDMREDSVDKCPVDKEDIDGFEDEDGCPEPDNDGDNILDADDRCPLDKEDGKAPYDKDGCPADKRDSDDDGVSDAMDRCPDDFEDADEFEDWDGCPEEDNDNDGLADDDDQCPLCPEDKDGFNDEDGCPDVDNDKDGVPDSADQCPNEAESFNGKNDEDGCPDGGSVAVLDGNRLQVNSPINFSRHNTLRDKRVIRQVAGVMKAHSDVLRWRIVVAAVRKGGDDATRAASQAQAQALKDELVASGIGADAIEAMGAVSDNPIVAIAVLERAEEGPELLCPASAQVQPRPKPETPAPAPAMPAEPAKPAAPAAAPAPAAPAPAAPAAVPDAFSAYSGVVKDIRLKRNKAKLIKSSNKTLEKIAALMKDNASVVVEIVAHTDSRKGPEKSLQITTEQAKVVADALAGMGVDRSRITAVGRGMDEPIDDNKKSKGRQANRRVELHFSVK
jgi:outer membrane protein OmpA-like peptidoglycan-associated protein